MEIVNKTTYFLNKSRTKWVNIGLARQVKFQPIVQICSSAEVYTFTENEWLTFLEKQGILVNYFLSPEAITSNWQPVQTNDYTISFKKVNVTKVIHILKETEEKSSGIFLASESLFELFDLLRLIQVRIDVLKRQDFNSYYEDILKRAVRRQGNFIIAIYDLLRLEAPSENSCALLELVHWFPDKVKEDESTVAKSN